MLIEKKTGNLRDFPIDGRIIDPLRIEWFETSKRISRKRTVGGREVSMRFLGQDPALEQGDVLYADESVVIAVDIQSCVVIRIRPSGWQQLAAVCYEIGNKHLPLYVDGEALLTPFDAPLLKQLQSMGYDCSQEEARLQTALRTSVAAHAHSGESLFSNILDLANWL